MLVLSISFLPPLTAVLNVLVLMDVNTAALSYPLNISIPVIVGPLLILMNMNLKSKTLFLTLLIRKIPEYVCLVS